MKRIAVVLGILVMSISLGSAANKSNFTFSATFGPHPVGFRAVHQYDYSRVYKPASDLEGKPSTGERARPIQTLIWYPARPDASAQPMPYGRYIDLLATEENFDPDSAQKAAALRAALLNWGISGKYDIERVQPTHAFGDAKPAPGRFPVVIYAPSFSAPAFENSDLCEYLASHGYVVVASPDMGARSRSMTEDVVGIQTQAADIEFLIGYLRDLPQADMSQIAVAGFSWGGISNVFASMLDDRITALVCLEGTIRYAGERIKEVRYVTPSRLTVPLLFLAQRNLSIEELSQRKLDVSVSFLNDVKYSDFHFVSSSVMEHGDFSSASIRFRPDEQFTPFTAAEVSEGYSWMARYGLNFLNAYLKNDAGGRDFLKASPEANGAPRHQLAVQYRQALRPAPVLTDFARELANKGFDNATAIWQEAKKKDPGYMLSEQEVNLFGYRLMTTGKLDKAIAIFKLNVAMYPESSNTYDSLAEAQAESGDTQGAIA
ncbi:MAG: hypothetical protein WCC00_09430, partial [Candidatus Aminicenantales bacterium]